MLIFIARLLLLCFLCDYKNYKKFPFSLTEQIISSGIGKVDDTELLAIASDPSSYYRISNVKAIMDIRSKVLNTLCTKGVYIYI